MLRRNLLVLILLAFVVISSGCNTLKGAAQGFQEDWKEAKKIDDWLRKNLW